jgi:hypothetical protein
MFELGDRVVMVDRHYTDGYAITEGSVGTVIAIQPEFLGDEYTNPVYVAWDDDQPDCYPATGEVQLSGYEEAPHTWWVCDLAIKHVDDKDNLPSARLTRKIQYLYNKQEGQSWRKKKSSSSDTSLAPTVEAETTSESGLTDTSFVSAVDTEPGLEDEMLESHAVMVERLIADIRRRMST